VFIMRNLRLRKALLLLVVMPLLAGIVTGQCPLSYAGSGIQIVVNGQPVSADTVPIMMQGHVLVPVRAIFEALGGTLDWNSTNRTVIGQKSGNQIRLSIGNKQAIVNGNPVTMDIPAMIIDGRTMVPVRFVSESLGATVSWDSVTNTVAISLPQTSQTPSAGIITTVPGTWSPSDSLGGYFWGGGSITNLATDLAIDNDGNLYLAGVINGSGIIRKVDKNGIITAIAGGNGIGEYSGNGGPAVKAGIAAIDGIAIDNTGNLYLSDAGYSCIRKIDPNGIITTVAGIGTPGYPINGPATSAELYLPAGLATDKSGDIYFADEFNYCIRKVNSSGIITTVAGSGPNRRGYWGDGGPATAAELNFPHSVAVDSNGNLYIADTGNNCIRKVDPNGIITTVAGNGTSGYSGDGGPATGAELNDPCGITMDTAGNLYIADTGNNCIRKVDPHGIITTIAGNGTPGYTGDGGLATSAELNGPADLALDSTGNLYVADAGNDCIRKIAEVGMEISSNKPDQAPATSSTSTDLSAWDPFNVLTFNNHYYTVSSITVNEDEIGSYLTFIGYYGGEGGAFRLYAITKFPNYEEIAVQTKVGYLLATEGDLVGTTAPKTSTYSWNDVLTFNNHHYTVCSITVDENEIGSYLTSISYIGGDPGALSLYAMTKFPSYEEIAVQIKSWYFLAVEGDSV